MRIDDCIPLMSKTYLSRIADAILRDEIPRGDETRMASLLRQSVDELGDPSRIQAQLQPETMTHTERVLLEAILTGLLKEDDRAANEEDLFEGVRAFEQAVLDTAQEDDALRFADAQAVDVYTTVLEVALEDDVITADEFSLLYRLRQKLGLSRVHHRLILARLGCFPQKGNEVHGYEDFKEALKSLQRRGLVFYCNKAKGGAQVVLPDEMTPGVRAALRFEMREEAQLLLHDALSNPQLREILETFHLPLSGTKVERSQRLVTAGIRPSRVIGALSGSELHGLCKSLPGVKSTGAKPELQQRVIDHFGSLSFKTPEESDDPRAVFYQYFEEFAARDNQNLYQLGLIKHDREMERAFEEGTRYLFDTKLGLELIDMPGTEHADGGVFFPNGEVLLWDNKSKESKYAFPAAHQNQFRRYIHDSVTRVNAFLVIVPDFDPRARLQAMKLKHDTKTDTDIAIISARDIKWVAETWRDAAKRESFSIELFNYTGTLDRQTLEERMGLLL